MKIDLSWDESNAEKEGEDYNIIGLLRLTLFADWLTEWWVDFDFK